MLNGQVYADKPALYFWLVLAIAKPARGWREKMVPYPSPASCFVA
jgi:hypothetical protein